MTNKRNILYYKQNLRKRGRIRKKKIILRKLALGKCVPISKCIQAAPRHRNDPVDPSYVSLSRDFLPRGFLRPLGFMPVLSRISECSNARFTSRVAEKSYVPTRTAGTIGADCCSAAWVIPIATK